MKTGSILINYIPYKCVILENTQEKEYGLMKMKPPVPITVFLFELGNHNFWMKDTIAPLDICFVKNKKIVSIKEGKPLSKELVGDESDMVVEFNKGFCSSNNIKVGDTIILRE